MRKIGCVEIENFRSFSKLKIKELGDVNVIVGKNNTGKSTFLEALFLSLGRTLAISVIRNTIKALFSKRGISFRGVELVGESEYHDIKSLLEGFFFFDIEKGEAFINSSLGRCTIEKKISSRLLQLESELLEPYSPFEILKIGNLGKIVFTEIRPPEGSNEKKAGLLSRLLEVYHPLKIILFSFPEKNGGKTLPYKIFLDSSLFCPPSGSGLSQFKKLAKNLESFALENTYTRLKKVISPFFETKVKNIFPTFSDLFIETEEGKIPFSLTGDGIKNLTVSFIALNLDRPSYVFFEEPETFLHPKMMDVLSKEIASSGKRHQIFLSTHSLEFVEKLLFYAQREPIELKVLGFYRLLNGELDYEIYDKEQAYVIVNKLEEDLR